MSWAEDDVTAETFPDEVAGVTAVAFSDEVGGVTAEAFPEPPEPAISCPGHRIHSK